MHTHVVNIKEKEGNDKQNQNKILNSLIRGGETG